tara:strand:+ start:760 stop:1956 length:1197 start_codon:yes stop_codon:yes gene_type:complete
MASRAVLESAEALLKNLRNFDRNKKLPQEAKPLLKSLSDEEVARMSAISSLHGFLSGMSLKLSGPRSGDNWFPGATKKLSVPKSELDAGRIIVPRSSNYEAPVTPLNWEDLQGTTIFPLIGDRTATGTLKQLAGEPLRNPVDLPGGKNYMRAADTGAWASEAGALKSLTGQIPYYESPVGVFMPMAGTGSDFARQTTNVLHEVWSPSDMTRTGIRAVNKKLRTGVGIDGVFPDAPSIDSPKFMAEIEVNSPLRKAYIQALDDAALRKFGGPDMGIIRHGITDLDLMNLPSQSGAQGNEQLMGFAATDLDPGGATRPSTHETYDTDLLAGPRGYLGALPLAPRSTVMRDWTRMRRGVTPKTGGDPRSLFTGPAQAPQTVDQELIDTLKAYEIMVDRAKD